MRAIILAAGQGRRLLPFTSDCPKSCVDVGGTTPIELMRDTLALCGVQDLVVVVGHRAEEVVAQLGDRPHYVENPSYATTNSLHSFMVAGDWATEGALVINADVLVGPSCVQDLIDAPAANALLFERHEEYDDEQMKLVHDAGGRLVAIGKNLPEGAVHGENLGVLKLSRAGVASALRYAREEAKAGRNQRWMPQALHVMVDQMPVHCIEIGDRPWIEIDFPEDLERARMEVLPAIRRRIAGRVEVGV